MKMHLSLVFLALGLWATAAKAELGVGVLGSYHMSDNYTLTDGVAGESMTGKGGSSYGGYLFLPIFPMISFRFGLEYESLSANDSATSVKSTASNLLIPLNLQFDLPLTDLYAFGGVIFVSNQKTDPGPGKFGSDMRMDVGLGYNIFAFGPAKIGLEVEYMTGTKNIAPDSTRTLKLNSLTANLMARFTL